MMDDGISLSSSDSAMKSKERKKPCATFKIQIKIHYLSRKQSMMHCLIIGKNSAFVIRPLKVMLKSVVEILSLQKLEYEMDCADPPDDYIFLNRVLWSPCLPLHTYST